MTELKITSVVLLFHIFQTIVHWCHSTDILDILDLDFQTSYVRNYLERNSLFRQNGYSYGDEAIAAAVDLRVGWAARPLCAL